MGDHVENDLPGALEIVRAGWATWEPDRPRWSLVLLDLRFATGIVTERSHGVSPGMPEGRSGDDEHGSFFGLRLLDAIRDSFPDLPVIILSSQPRQASSREFSRRGARAFLARDEPDGAARLSEYLSRYGLIEDDTGVLVGHSRSLLKVLCAARATSAHRLNLLIRGEPGVGRQLLTRYIHRHRAAEPPTPFVEVNSAVLSNELFASELFGIERGTATGVEPRMGRIQAAH